MSEITWSRWTIDYYYDPWSKWPRIGFVRKAHGPFNVWGTVRVTFRAFFRNYKKCWNLEKRGTEADMEELIVEEKRKRGLLS
jgi:hypothetical protein